MGDLWQGRRCEIALPVAGKKTLCHSNAIALNIPVAMLVKPRGNRRLSGASTARALNYLTVAAPTLQAASSCDPVPSEQPIAPTIFPASMSGIPPREAMMPSRLSA